MAIGGGGGGGGGGGDGGYFGMGHPKCHTRQGLSLVLWGDPLPYINSRVGVPSRLN